MLYSPRRQAPRLLLTTLRVSFVLLLFAATRARAQTITEYPIPTPASLPVEIIAGPDGNLWFAEFAVGVRSIGRITLDFQRLSRWRRLFGLHPHVEHGREQGS